MWTIETRIISPRELNDINVQSVCNMTDMIDSLKIISSFSMCDDILTLDSNPNTCYLDLIEDEDINTLLYEILFKNGHRYCGTNTPNTISVINAKDLNAPILGTSFSQSDTRILNGLFIKNERDFLIGKRYLLDEITSYEQFINYASDTFMNIVFHPDSLDSIRKLGKFQEVKSELYRHLDILNDYAQQKYNELGRNEAEVLQHLDSAFGIKCSGKGSNETIRYKIEFEDVELTCSPHTKFYHGGNDQRIYFAWGNPNFKNGKLIICKIGDHWA